MNVVDFAYQVIEMQELINALVEENSQLRDYKEKYQKLLDEDTKHHKAMMGNILSLCLTPGVVEACQKNNTFSKEII
jgi:hypothetical protein